MKNRFIIITLLFLSLGVTGQAYAAATPTPTGTAVSQALNNQINQLKDKIASRVSQLNLVEKRGIIGTIQDVTSNQITLTDTKAQIRYIDVDEITKFSSAGSSASFGLSDLKKGMSISAFGIYNKESQRILARFVDTLKIPTRYSGEIAAIDAKNFQLTVTTGDQKTVKVEIDTTSTVSSYTTTDATLTKYGFSKLAVGDRVLIVGYPDKKDSSLLITDRLIDFLNAPKDPNITLVTPTPEATIAPTTTGAKSIKPIK